MRLPRWVWVFAFLVCWPSIVLAVEYSAADENGKLTLTENPCKQHPWLKEWKLARWFFQGKPYEACWTVQPTRTGGQMVVVIDSAGVVTPLPPQIFKPDEGV